MMKKMIAFILPFLTTVACAQVSGQINDYFLFEPTPVGLPDGEKKIALISKEGGSIISADNKIELIFPAGSLSSETSVSIQPSFNTSPDGIGKSYSLEPSGISFQQPVQLIFHYSDTDLDKNNPLLIGIVSQDNKGVWYGLRKVRLDTISKTITGNINHFSMWSINWAYHFKPEKTRVKVSKEVIIHAYLTPISDYPPEERVEAINGVYGERFQNPRKWTANEVENGNAENGTIDHIMFPLADRYVTYTAPAKVPDKNPVEITLEIQNVDLGLGGGPNHTISRKCNIQVYDNEYEVKMEAQLVGGSPAEWGGVATYSDKGSFTVSLDNNNPAVINIRNYLEKVKYSTCPERVITNPRTCTGIFHVAGTKQIKVTPANPPGQLYPIVEIWFVPYPTELTRFTFNCPPPPSARGHSKGKVDLTTAAPGMPPPMLMFFGMPALPPYLKFIANDEEQILMESPRGVREIYYKIWVKKVNED